MIKTPLISVVIASYNHATYIKEAIFSVLKQTYQNFEIIITDDGSTDNSCEIIRSINDSRIKLFVFEKNKGACIAMNHCILNAKGDYIAVMNSDDVWEHDKLEKQIQVFIQDPSIDAVFSNAAFFNENLKEFENKPSYFDIFNQNNRSQGEWLRRFFFEGNCLCHPSILIKKSCYDILGLYDNRYRQLPDFDMWIKFCKHFKLFIIPEKLVKFRVLDGDKNASSPSEVNQIRGKNEGYFIMKDFFDQMSIEIFKEGFSTLLKNPEFITQEEFEVEKALLYLATPYSVIGIEKLYKLLRNDNFSNVLKSYKITDKEFHQIASQYNSFSHATKSVLIKDAMKEVWGYPKVKLLKIALKYIINIFKHKIKNI